MTAITSLAAAVKAHSDRAAAIRNARTAGLAVTTRPRFGEDYRDAVNLTSNNAERTNDTINAMKEVLDEAFRKIAALASDLSDAGDRFDPLNLAVAFDDALDDETFDYRMALDEAADMGHHRAGRIDFKHDQAAE